nr:DUF4031 domain-containing protein [Actinomycetales bacterium]
MAILIDQPRWPNHGTLWAHVVSDSSLSELHGFAAAAGIPARGFDHDHYDVPARLHTELIARGAEPVTSLELARRLIDAGLRVRARDRTPSRAVATEELQRRWQELLPQHAERGVALLARWSERHRHYHDVRHLAHCLTSLDELTDSAPERPVALAAWYHDAVYEGVPGEDEEASAVLAERELEEVIGRAEAREVGRLVRLTAAHAPGLDDERGTLLSDADLSILAVNNGRYHVYLRDVRLDFAHVGDADFREGRRRVVEGLLATEPLFRTHRGHALWEAAARANLLGELQFPAR